MPGEEAVKRPSFQFYPGDWLRVTELRACSVGARGLWIDMICLMHEGRPYGHLKAGDKVILPPNLARMVGATFPEVEGWLAELKEAGVYSLDASGCIFSRRMVRDENLRRIRAEGGKLGGNPALLKVHNKVNLQANLKPTPSSSSSSSSSSASSTATTSKEKIAPAASQPDAAEPLPKDRSSTTTTLPTKRIRARATPAEPAAGAATWAAYSGAYFKRYGAEPVRNAKVNRLIANVVERLGAEDAPHVASFFVTSNRGLYVSATHAVDLLSRDCEALRTQWAKGVATTDGAARATDRTATTGNVFSNFKKDVLDAKQG